jgi:uncharacterized membrane protein
VADAVVRGGAVLALVVIVPVVTGGSAEFLTGVALLLIAFFTLPWLLWEGPASRPSVATLPKEGTDHAPPGASGGGLVLIGPVPIFFGAWKGVSARMRWWVAIAGAVAVVAFAVLWVLVVR